MLDKSDLKANDFLLDHFEDYSNPTQFVGRISVSDSPPVQILHGPEHVGQGVAARVFDNIERLDLPDGQWHRILGTRSCHLQSKKQVFSYLNDEPSHRLCTWFSSQRAFVFEKNVDLLRHDVAQAPNFNHGRRFRRHHALESWKPKYIYTAHFHDFFFIFTIGDRLEGRVLLVPVVTEQDGEARVEVGLAGPVGLGLREGAAVFRIKKDHLHLGIILNLKRKIFKIHFFREIAPYPIKRMIRAVVRVRAPPEVDPGKLERSFESAALDQDRGWIVGLLDGHLDRGARVLHEQGGVCVEREVQGRDVSHGGVGGAIDDVDRRLLGSRIAHLS